VSDGTYEACRASTRSRDDLDIFRTTSARTDEWRELDTIADFKIVEGCHLDERHVKIPIVSRVVAQKSERFLQCGDLTCKLAHLPAGSGTISASSR